MATSNDGSNMADTFYRKHTILCHLAMVCCVTVFLGFFSLFFIDVWTNHGRTTVVPEVRKKTFEEATEILKKSNLKFEISDSVYDQNSDPGIVKEIWPHPGTKVKPGRVIYLTINSFQPQLITIGMPLTGVSSRQAMSYLESLNIKNVRIVYVPSNFSDLVEGAKYDGKSIKPGMKIPVNANIVLEVGTKANQQPVYDEPDPVTVDTEAGEANDANDDTDTQHNDSEHDTKANHADTPDNVSNPEVFD